MITAREYFKDKEIGHLYTTNVFSDEYCVLVYKDETHYGYIYCTKDGKVLNRDFFPLNNSNTYFDYTKSKEKVKLYQYAFKSDFYAWHLCDVYYKNDEDFLNRCSGQKNLKFMRLDHTMIEVSED